MSSTGASGGYVFSREMYFVFVVVRLVDVDVGSEFIADQTSSASRSEAETTITLLVILHPPCRSRAL